MTNLTVEELQFMVFQLAKMIDETATGELSWEDVLEEKDNKRLNELWNRLDEIYEE